MNTLEKKQPASASGSSSGEHIAYLDGLRTIACFAVVVFHLCTMHWYHTDVRTLAWQAMNLYDSAVRWCVPVFFMISGALFLDPDRDVSVRKIYARYLPRIVCAFLFWSFVYMIKQGLFNGFYGVSILLIEGHYHMWFLFAIGGLYIITPLVRRITASEEMTKYFLVIWLVFGVVIPRLLSVDELLGDFPLSWLLRSLKNDYSSAAFHFAVGYVGYYVLGYYLRKWSEPSWVMWGSAVGFLAVEGLSDAVAIWKGMPTGFFFEFISVPVLLESIAVFCFGKRYLSNIRHPRLNGIVKALSRYSFGIYLVHALIIELLEALGLHPLAFSPLLSIPILAVVVFTISAAISAMLNRIPILKDYVV